MRWGNGAALGELDLELEQQLSLADASLVLQLCLMALTTAIWVHQNVC